MLREGKIYCPYPESKQNWSGLNIDMQTGKPTGIFVTPLSTDFLRSCQFLS
jgi:hypothetical protein